VLDFLVVCIMIYRISLIIKNGPGSVNCIILLLRLKEKYRDDDNSRISGPTLEDRSAAFRPQQTQSTCY
jgi:hypothetical protein